jgi:hypothetical protein
LGTKRKRETQDSTHTRKEDCHGNVPDHCFFIREKSLPVERNGDRESTTEGRKRDLISKEELNYLEHGNTTGTFGRFTKPLSGQTMYCL